MNPLKFRASQKGRYIMPTFRKKEITMKIDPDFIFTEDGDSFAFPFLIHRVKRMA